MDKPKGVRYILAPSTTKTIRTPVELQDQIHGLIQRYRDWIDNIRVARTVKALLGS